MKKRILTVVKRSLKPVCLFGVLACVLSACSDDIRNAPDCSFRSYDLNRKVDSLEVRTWRAKMESGTLVKGRLTKNPDDIFIARFDESGNVWKHTAFDSRGKMSSLCEYTYEKGHLVYIDRYDRNGKRESALHYLYQDHFKFLCHTSLMSADEKMETMESQLFSKEDKSHTQELFTKYANGSEQYSFSKSHEWKDGRIVKTVVCDDSGFEAATVEYSYDQNGKLVKMCSGDSEGFYEVFVEYNDKLYASLSSGAKINTRGKIVTDVDYDVYYYEYEYDEKGNWIKRITFAGENKKPLEISEREIFY